MRMLALAIALLLGLAVAPGHAQTAGHAQPGGARTADAAATDTAVPWDQVGPGWLLATVDQGRWRGPEMRTRTRRLELVAPDGTRHVLTTLRLREQRDGYYSNDFLVADWLPEEHVVLLQRWAPDGREVVEVELETGKFRSLTLRVSDAGAVGLLPDRSGVLVVSLRGKLHAVDWLGDRDLVTRGFSGPAITSPDGTLVVGAHGRRERLVVVPLDGSARRTLDTRGHCYPLRWYDADSVLVSCHLRRGSQLRVVGLDGSDAAAAPYLPTGKSGYRGPSWADTDVRVAGGRTYYEGNGPCGGSFLTTQRANGTLKMVEVPGAETGVDLLGVRDERLLVAHSASCDGGRPVPVLGLFDPVSKDEQVLVKLAEDERWGRILPYGEVHAWR